MESCDRTLQRVEGCKHVFAHLVALGVVPPAGTFNYTGDGPLGYESLSFSVSLGVISGVRTESQQALSVHLSERYMKYAGHMKMLVTNHLSVNLSVEGVEYTFEGCGGDTPLLVAFSISRWKNHCARLFVHVQVTASHPMRGDDEIVLDGACLWRVAGHVELNTNLVQLSLKLGTMPSASKSPVSLVDEIGVLALQEGRRWRRVRLLWKGNLSRLGSRRDVAGGGVWRLILVHDDRQSHSRRASHTIWSKGS